MNKIITIAIREYRAMVGTKAFLFSLIMMPVLMGGSLFALQIMKNVGEVKERKIVVIDNTGGIVPAIRMAALTHNAAIDKKLKKSAGNQDDDDGDGLSFAKGYRYLVETLDAKTVDDDLRCELSDKIRNKELDAFVEIPEKVHEFKADGSLPTVDFYSEESGISDTRQWLARALNQRVQVMRMQKLGIDYKQVEIAQAPVVVRSLGLIERSSDGTITAGAEKDTLTAIFLPFGAMMLMFVVTFLAAQPMLESVLEEKSQRIAEVLLGSANPTQLMSGKLLGTVAGSLTIFAIYATGGFFVAQSQGYADLIPIRIVPWFVVFQILSVVFYAAVFMAVGASVSQLKEAQSLLLPVWMLLMIPMFVWIFIVQDPNGTMATWLSLFPPATATTMVLRLATGATIPLWQLVVGIALLAAATVIVVVLAGRIFRVGILWQGKTPKIGELFRWALTG